MSKYTPGPWRLVADRSHYDTLTTIEGGAIGTRKPFGRQMIVQVGGDASYTEAEANARAIHQVPEMLELLVDLHKLFTGYNHLDKRDFNKYHLRIWDVLVNAGVAPQSKKATSQNAL